MYLALLAWSAGVVSGAVRHRSISVLCSSIDEVCREWAEGFTRSSGIEVVMVRVSTGEALVRLSRTAARGGYDVWHGGPADSYEVARSRGLLQPYRSPEAAAVQGGSADPDGWWTGTYLGVLGFCSNQRVLARLNLPAPTSWEDLLRPELDGEVSVPSPLSSGTGYTVAWTQRLRLGGDDAAIEFLRRLHGNVLQYTNSGLAPARIAGRGEAAVAVTFTQHCQQARADGMTDLVVTYPQEGTGFEIGSVAVVAGAPDLDGARRYVDYALTRQAQRTAVAQLPTRADVPADPGLGSDARLLDYVPADAAKARELLTQRWVTQVQR
ncbi:MAG: ABC transporter substrate-binding protein [Micropruina sp.]|nr:MAG: ABC transporter substrate-binding protein [Micropruina sp.]